MRHHLAAAAALFLTCASAATIRTAEVPFQLTQNHVFLPVAIGHHQPSWFLLDTGAGMTAVAQTTADATGLVATGRGKARGAGPGVVETTLHRDVDLRVAGTSIHIPLLSGIPLTAVSLPEGRSIEGILGYNVIEQFAIEIDYAHRILRFHAPSSYAPPAGAVAVPITFDQGHPVANAELTLPDGRTLPMRMMVDTGARGGVVVNTPFAEKRRVYDAIAPTLEGAFGVGIGGASAFRVGRAKQFKFAGVAFDVPVVSASLDRAGAVANPNLDGIIGAEVLRRFTVTIDYAHRRLLFVPNAALREPFEFDMAGTGFKAANLKFDRILVRYVLPHTPAAEAGLQEGDELVSVNGRPAAALMIDGLRALFQQPDKRYVLRVRRGGREIEMALVTRRLV